MTTVAGNQVELESLEPTNRTLAGDSGFQINDQQHDHLAAQLGNPVVGDQPGKQLLKLFTNVMGMEFLEGTDHRWLEQNPDGHHFRGQSREGLIRDLPPASKRRLHSGRNSWQNHQ